MDIKTYNMTEECNRLRYSYLVKIKHAYENYDFSDLFDDLDDNCIWGGASNKEGVIEKLKKGAISMRERNYWHQCTIVQVESPIIPTELNTKPDGTGKKVLVSLNYTAGEFCMIDRTSIQTLFFRLQLSPCGKIKEYYATLPPSFFHPIEPSE